MINAGNTVNETDPEPLEDSFKGKVRRCRRARCLGRTWRWGRRGLPFQQLPGWVPNCLQVFWLSMWLGRCRPVHGDCHVIRLSLERWPPRPGAPSVRLGHGQSGSRESEPTMTTV